MIVRASGGVTVIGAGEVTAAVLDQALSFAPLLVAADGGAGRALALGHLPEALIGDLDSVDEATLARVPPGRVHRLDEQETTDFEKCLRSISAPLVLAVGFTGARLDHGLAAFAALVRHARQPTILIGPEDVAFAAPRSLTIGLPAGTRLSLFPMGPVRGRSVGLRWPIDGIRFAPAGRIGTSNETVAPEVRLDFTARRMLVLLPRTHLSAAIRAAAPRFSAPASARGG